MIPAAPLITGAAAGAAGAGASGIMSALGGFGSLLSGVSGLFGGSKQNNKAMWSQLNAMEEIERRRALELPVVMAKGWKRAGIHPLAGMGLNLGSGPSFSVGGGGSDSPAAVMDSMGQGITRAASAYASKDQRRIEMLSAGLALENQQLQNERLRSEIRQMNAVGSPRPVNLTSDGNGVSLNSVGVPDGVKIVDKEIKKSGSPGVEVGAIPGMQVVELPGLGEVLMPTQDTAEATEASYILPLVMEAISGADYLKRNIWDKRLRYNKKPKFPRYKKGG